MNDPSTICERKIAFSILSGYIFVRALSLLGHGNSDRLSYLWLRLVNKVVLSLLCYLLSLFV